jgi:hypothetical protein
MTQPSTYIKRTQAEVELFRARRMLAHFVELYESGQWRRLYKDEVFAGTIRQARETVDHWTDVLTRCDSRA